MWQIFLDLLTSILSRGYFVCILYPRKKMNLKKQTLTDTHTQKEKDQEFGNFSIYREKKSRNEFKDQGWPLATMYNDVGGWSSQIETKTPQTLNSNLWTKLMPLHDRMDIF